MSFPLPQTLSCYFCAIVDGKTEPWNVIEQSALTVTLLNGRQFEVGQCLVLPSRHAPTLLDLTTEEDAAVMAAAKRVTTAMVESFSPDGVLLYQNNGVGSGQEVPHFHLHVVPRRAGSNWGMGPPHLARLAQMQSGETDHEVITEEKRNTAQQLRTACRMLDSTDGAA